MLWNFFLRHRKQNCLEKRDKQGFPRETSVGLKIISILGCLTQQPHPCVWMHGKGRPLHATSIPRGVWKTTSNGNVIPSWPIPTPATPVSPQPPPVALSSGDVPGLHAQSSKIPFPCHVLHFFDPFYSWKAQKLRMFSRNIPALPHAGNKRAESSNIFYIFSPE